MSYARAASRGDEAHGENASSTEVDFLEKQVVDFCKQNGIEFSSNNISTCHTLGKPRDGIKRMILVKFTNRKIKEHIPKNKKKLKGTGVFVNEHLSPKNVDISIFARTLRRQNKIQNTWTRNCKVYIKLMVYLKCLVYYALKILLNFTNFPIDKISSVEMKYISLSYLCKYLVLWIQYT